MDPAFVRNFQAESWTLYGVAVIFFGLRLSVSLPIFCPCVVQLTAVATASRESITSASSAMISSCVSVS